MSATLPVIRTSLLLMHPMMVIVLASHVVSCDRIVILNDLSVRLYKTSNALFQDK